MNEPLPLATVHEAVLEFLRYRDDAVLFGAQAVNAYVDEPRMTQDVDIMSANGADFAEELRVHLNATFHIAIRVRAVRGGKGFRIYQLREPKNRHLVDVRQVNSFPPTQTIADVRVPVPEELIAQKILSIVDRQGQPKEDTDRRDVKVLLLRFPQLKTEAGPVHDRLQAANADEQVLAEWRDLVSREIKPDNEEW